MATLAHLSFIDFSEAIGENIQKIYDLISRIVTQIICFEMLLGASHGFENSTVFNCNHSRKREKPKAVGCTKFGDLLRNTTICSSEIQGSMLVEEGLAAVWD